MRQILRMISRVDEFASENAYTYWSTPRMHHIICVVGDQICLILTITILYIPRVKPKNECVCTIYMYLEYYDASPPQICAARRICIDTRADKWTSPYFDEYIFKCWNANRGKNKPSLRALRANLVRADIDATRATVIYRRESRLYSYIDYIVYWEPVVSVFLCFMFVCFRVMYDTRYVCVCGCVVQIFIQGLIDLMIVIMIRGSLLSR